jgi:hypothetical protein
MTALRNHSITINEDGEVQGRVATINHKSRAAVGVTEAAVYFIQDGKVVKKEYTNEDGTFVVSGLKPGLYSFAAAGEFSFATCGVNVVRAENDKQRYLEIAAISPNVAAVQEIIENGLPKTVRNEIVKNFKPGDHQRNVVGSNRVELDGDVLAGQVVSLIGDKLGSPSKAHLFKANSKVKEFAVGSDGTFEIDGLEPGVYDFVVTSPQGVAAVSFEAVASLDEASEAYTSVQDGLFSSFIVALAPQGDCGAIGGCCSSCGGGSDAIVYGDSPAGFLGNRLGNGIAGGGCCGGAGNFTGFGGCCGGGGRFGGLFGGRSLLIPAIAAGIAIPLAVGGASETNVN